MLTSFEGQLRSDRRGAQRATNTARPGNQQNRKALTLIYSLPLDTGVGVQVPLPSEQRDTLGYMFRTRTLSQVPKAHPLVYGPAPKTLWPERELLPWLSVPSPTRSARRSSRDLLAKGTLYFGPSTSSRELLGPRSSRRSSSGNG